MSYKGKLIYHPIYGVGKVMEYSFPFYNIYFYKKNELLIFDESKHIYWAYPHEIEPMLAYMPITLRNTIERRQQCK